MTALQAPARDCPSCPRLVAYRAANRLANPGWFNAPVPSFGAIEARLLVVGMAPGVTGANRTGRPFTGDYCGTLLYETLVKFGFAQGVYQARADDGLTLIDTRITNAVRCVPPANKLIGAEVAACNGFLAAEMRAMPRLRVVFTLGLDGHKAVLRAMGLPAARLRFAHGAVHALPNGVALANSYHVSRYNTSTRRLTTPMFESAMSGVADILRRAPA